MAFAKREITIFFVHVKMAFVVEDARVRQTTLGPPLVDLGGK
jgi:hypothetical protein